MSTVTNNHCALVGNISCAVLSDNKFVVLSGKHYSTRRHSENIDDNNCVVDRDSDYTILMDSQCAIPIDSKNVIILVSVATPLSGTLLTLVYPLL